MAKSKQQIIQKNKETLKDELYNQFKLGISISEIQKSHKIFFGKISMLINFIDTEILTQYGDEILKSYFKTFYLKEYNNKCLKMETRKF